MRAIPLAIRTKLAEKGARLLLSGLILTVTACGDGGRAPAPNGERAVPEGDGELLVGVLSPGPISGVTYETKTTTGVTDASGTFQYAPGETVRFRLGDTTLGDVVGQAEVTPFDLAGAEVPIGNNAVRLATNEPADAFHKVINLAVLLYTLDTDRDPKNGIEVAENVAGVLDGVSLRLNEQWFEFVGDNRFRSALGAIRSVLGRRPVVKPAYAMEALYAALEIDADLYRMTAKKSDVRDPWVRTWEYDARGKTIRHAFDEGLDGIFEEDYSYEHSLIGDQIALTANEGRAYFESLLYDDDGNLIQTTHTDGDSAVTTERREYDSGGNLILTTVEYDDDRWAGGMATLEYDARGNVVLKTLTADDGMVRQTAQYYYDDNDNLVVYAMNNGDDDQADYVAMYEYDDRNRKTREGIDSEGDGVIDTFHSFDYDARGNLTRRAKDLNADGIADSVDTTEFDHWGNPTRAEFDYDANGVGGDVWTWEYDEDGKETRHTRSNGNTSADIVETHMYYTTGMLSDLDIQVGGKTSSYYSHSYESTQGWVTLLGE